MKHKAVRQSFFSLFLFPALSIFSLAALAQQNHFIYIQTENKQAFYVRLDKKLYSSSASGYVILPKLTDGSYAVAIGFPKNEWPEQNVTCRVDKKDAGYSLKNFGEKGWGLFNLQTLEIAMAVAKIEIKPVLKDTTDDPFSNMLSTVVNDRTLKEKEPVTEEPKQEVKEEPNLQVNEDNKILRLAINNGSDGTEMVFVDRTAEKPDTIRLFIPTDKTSLPVVKKEEPKTVLKEDSKPLVKDEPKKREPKKEEVKKNNKFIDIEIPNPNTQTAPAIKTEEKKADSIVAEEKPKSQAPENKTKPSLINSDCKNFASETDYILLRKRMVAEDNDDDMVVVARKVFKTKCFTTGQVKSLSALFLKDDGKYKFFDAVYPYVSDFQNFSSLESELTDAYFISRFKAMLKH